MSTGYLCWLDKQNTVAACFTPVPVCQAICSKEACSSKHNGEFESEYFFSYLALSVSLLHKDSLTILFTFTPTNPSQSAARAQTPTSCRDVSRL